MLSRQLARVRLAWRSSDQLCTTNHHESVTPAYATLAPAPLKVHGCKGFLPDHYVHQQSWIMLCWVVPCLGPTVTSQQTSISHQCWLSGESGGALHFRGVPVQDKKRIGGAVWRQLNSARCIVLRQHHLRDRAAQRSLAPAKGVQTREDWGKASGSDQTEARSLQCEVQAPQMCPG